MKKIWIYFGMVALFTMTLSISPVSANSGPPIIGITIEPDICEEDYEAETEMERCIFPGNFDILVRTEDFDETSFSTMTDRYKEFYPFYEDIEYLDNVETGWTSFSAYYTKSHTWGPADHFCGMQFGDYKIVENMKYIKVVYFDDDGTTIHISDEIKVPNVLFFQSRDAVIYYNTSTNDLDANLKPYTSAYVVLTAIFIWIFILYSVGIELIVAFVFKFRTKKELVQIILINVITQVVMYVYFLLIFDSFESRYFTHLYIYEFLVLFIEFGYLYWRFKPISWKRLALYVFISNLVSYLAGIIRYY